MASTEGYQWTEANGLQQGLPTTAALSSTPSLSASYDVIGIGAGYAGLIASRDLAVSGNQVLLIEARDRIGGRTWTSVIDGFNYEMGGTWVNWKQPHFYAELSRYDIEDQLVWSPDYSSGVNCFTINTNGERRDIARDQQDALFASTLTKFFNVDGELAMKMLHANGMALVWEGRLEQLKGQLTEDETAIITSMALHMSGGTLKNTGFFDLLRWWALCDYKPEGIDEYGLALKMKQGQTSLATRILDDALGIGNLHVKAKSPVRKIRDSGQGVTVTTTDGHYKAKKVISTLPLNVLHETTFSPPLPNAKLSASKQGHINFASKIHFETPGHDLKSWSGMAWPGKGLLYAYGDGTTAKGSTHIVGFGAAETHLNGDGDIEATKAAMNAIRDFEIDRIVFHNWARDPYAKGAWCMFDTGFASKYQAALQEDHGNVSFASADWADGWRGFIDGAIEQGAAVAHRVSRTLRRSKSKSRL